MPRLAGRFASLPEYPLANIPRRKRELLARGVDVGDVQEFPWGRFVFFADPDGNRWAVQQLPARPAG